MYIPVHVHRTFHYMNRKSFQFFVSISPNTHLKNERLAEYALYEQFVIQSYHKMFSEMYSSYFLDQYGPQISRLVVVAIAVPVSSVPCERGFSAAN